MGGAAMNAKSNVHERHEKTRKKNGLKNKMWIVFCFYFRAIRVFRGQVFL
jgi:hypothetical protein